MYKSPIELIYQGIRYEIDKGILKAVLERDINVDKDELIRALQYDRDQYNKGYSDGKRDAADELVRCKECLFWVECESSLLGKVMCCTGQGTMRISKKPDDFCSSGERKK